MAAKSKSKTASRDKISYSQINKLISLLGAQNLFNFLNSTFPHKKIAWRNATAIRMLCPVHDENTPSCDIDISTNRIHCYGCGYTSKNLLKFLGDSLGWSYTDAAQKIYEQTNIRVFNAAHCALLEELEIYELAISLIMKGCNKYASDCVVYWKTKQSLNEELYNENILELVQPTLDWLYIKRKHNPDVVAYLPYGIFPPLSILAYLTTDFLEKLNESFRVKSKPLLGPEKVLAITNKIHEIISNVDNVWLNAVTFHTGYGLNTPARIRLRKPHNEDKEMIALPGFEESDSTGFFGLYDPYNVFSKNDAKKLIPYVLEGENDVISWLERLWVEGKKDVLVFATGGNQNSLDDLFHAGFEKIRIVSDDPIGGGGNEYLKSRLATALEVDVRIFTNLVTLRHPGCKDIDDLLVDNKYDLVNRIDVFGQNNDRVSRLISTMLGFKRIGVIPLMMAVKGIDTDYYYSAILKSEV